MSRLSDVEVFVSVVRHGSFTGAARDLGISKSYASKQVRALEERLGARLLHRTTRTLTATDAGRAFADRCGDLLDDLDEAERAVSALQSAPRGVLRLTAPLSFGYRYVAPALASFLVQHPDLVVVADYSDRRVDLVNEGYDLAIRVGGMSDSSLIARRLAPCRGVLAASPDYLARHGSLDRPEDLRDHECIVYSFHDTPTTWSMRHRDGGGPVRVRVKQRLACNLGEATVDALLAGVGIAELPDFFLREPLDDGRLVEVLPGWSGVGELGVWAVYPHSRHLAAKVRLFVDSLAESLHGVSW